MTRTTPRKRQAVAVAGAVLAGSLLTQLVGPAAPAGAAAVPTTELFVRQAFTDATRNADPAPADVATAVTGIDGGRSKAEFVWSLLQSDPGRAAFVQYEFERILDRPVDPAGLELYTDRLEGGTTRPAIRSLLVGSNEYFTNAGGTNDAYVDAIFADLLGRPADPSGKAYWVGRLEAGVTRVKVANSFGNLSEGRRVRTDAIFRIYLDRAVDPAGATYWSNRLANGTTEERLIATLAGGTEYTRVSTTVPAAEAVVLLTDSNSLVVRTPGLADRTVPVTGLTATTFLAGIDVRPATGVLYAVGTDGQLYTVSTATGNADKVGGPIAGFDASAGVGVDFNPVANALRVVTGSANYRINANTGVVVGEGAPESGLPGTLQYVPGDLNEGVAPQATGAAYTNSTRGLPLPATTALFDLDTGTDALVRQNPANDGNLTTVGDLRLDATGVNGFDVSPDGTQVAYAVLTTANGQGLWKVDLTTGEPKLLDRFDGTSIIGLAVVGSTVPVPTEAALGLSADGLSIVSFTTTDTAVTATQVVAGQNVGTKLVAMDVRPSTGQLFALGSDGQLYTVDLAVPALATVTKANQFGPKVGFGELDLSVGVGFDFNPAADRIRITVGARNYRLQTNGVIDGEGPPNTGLPGTIQYVAGDPGFGATPQITGAAYTNSARSATLPTSTQLFDIDAGRDALVRQNPANAGDLTTIGALGVDVGGVDGFDVGGPGQVAYAAFTVGGTPGLYRVDLATGAASLVGALPAGLSGLAIR